ncbi:MAG: Smr/MutS family protein [Chloroflexi bacterium]|nr:Smr/MutS family protein [Chloroflexota bacterium]
MDAKHLRTLELDKVLARLAGLASFSASKELLLALQPETTLARVRAAQAATGEAVRLLASRPSLSIGAARDIRPLVERAKLGAILQPPDFLEVQGTIESARAMRELLHRAQLVYPELATYAGRLHPLRGLQDEIATTIDEHGEVVDSASPQLAYLRREVRSGRDRIMRRLEAIIADPNNAEAIQEPIVTERNGRYVIAIKAGFRHHIRGVVHDQSESGATLFLEPLATVDMTNDWRQSMLEEHKEVERILRVLSSRMALDATQLHEIVEALAALDAAFAKARLAEQLEAVEPDLNESGDIHLIDARHPLLTGTVVPQTITLGDGYRALVITGPNTGGKTVALKTVGLLTLLAECGLRIPAATGSKVSVFREVLADIGDEQSIEQSLSTFSGHLRNIVSMLKSADRHSLVLLDELGAGTDPDEGSALARAILEYLLAHDVTTIATTHYSELKTFAHNRAGVQNASVEFDVNTLSPTYKVRIGTPGRSNALAIAGRLGLPTDIIETARSGLSEEHLRTEALLEEISRKERVAARERNRASREEATLRRLRTQAAAALEEAERIRQEARERAFAEADAELTELRREAARLAQQLERARAERDQPAAVMAPVAAEPDHAAPNVDTLREQLVAARQAGDRELARELQRQLSIAGQAAREQPRDGELASILSRVRQAAGREALEAIRAELRGARRRRDWRRLSALEDELQQAQIGFDRETVGAIRSGLAQASTALEQLRPIRQAAVAASPARDLKVGQYVRVPGFGETGQLMTLPDDKGEVDVQVGAFTVHARAAELLKADRPRHRESDIVLRRAPLTEAPPSLSHPVDMRGIRADEVEPLLDRELNGALSAGVPYLKIIHGHGTGIVRRMVRDYLAQQPYVSSFEPASPADGGDGATIVTLAV